MIPLTVKSQSLLVKHKTLVDFSAASSVRWYNHRLYLVSDDETMIMVVDENYNKVDSIPLIDNPGKRLAKAEKLDLESSVLVQKGSLSRMLVFASASTPKRNRMFEVSPDETSGPRSVEKEYYRKFTSSLRPKLKEVNIEGVTLIGKSMVFANRGNHKFRANHLIIIPSDSLYAGHANSTFRLLQVSRVDAGPSTFAGLSEICFEDSLNMLFMTFSQEHTSDAYSDGKIGDSYIAWVKDANQKLGSEIISPDGIINLSSIDPALKNQKIEGICVGSVDGNKVMVHLVADNDDGKSRIFEVVIDLAQ